VGEATPRPRRSFGSPLSDVRIATAIELVGFGGDYDRMLRGEWFDADLPHKPVPYDNDLRDRQIKKNQARYGR
jgi:hypothetical protein